MNPYAVFLLYLLAILGFVAVTLLMNRLLGPKPVSSAMKLEPLFGFFVFLLVLILLYVYKARLLEAVTE